MEPLRKVVALPALRPGSFGGNADVSVHGRIQNQEIEAGGPAQMCGDASTKDACRYHIMWGRGVGHIIAWDSYHHVNSGLIRVHSNKTRSSRHD